MEMADSSFCENDLDEEKARRSILVTNVPGNFTYKDVIIHFQKGTNGGGEVDSGMYHDSENCSSVVITFEDPSTVETAIARRQVLGKTEVTVQRYPVGIRTPEVFSDVDARLNPEILDLLPSMERVLHDLDREHGIRCWKTAHGYTVIRGSYKQITSCHKYIRDEIAYNKSKGLGRSRPLHGHVAAAGATRDDVHVSPRYPGKSDDEDEEDDEDKEIYFKAFQSVPIILDFIFSVPKYSKSIEIIESELNVEIRGVEGGNKVVIKPLPGCTHEKHDDACEEYIKLYREVYDGPMMSKDIVLKPGKDSFYSSAEEAVKEVLKEAPVAIQNIEEPDKWLFYGEEANVRSAVKAVCKKLGIDQTPFRKTRKAVKTVVHHVLPEEEEKRAGTTSSTHVTLEDKAEGNPLTENFHELSSPNHNGLPADKEWPFEVKTKKGFRLQVYEGDITKERVDVIVNSADEFLDFWTGLSAALVKRGGQDIQSEAETKKSRRKTEPGDIIITGPGNLYCSKIAHILTKNYPSSKREECKKAVKDGCLKCLKRTQRDKLKSISFPAVGSGQQGMPIDKCAAAVISAVEEYMAASDPKKGAVTDIRFVHCDPSAVKVFQAELKKRYGDSIVKPTKDPSTQGKNETSFDKRGGPPAEKKTAKKENEENDVCPICLDAFHDPRILPKCNHKFCKLCIDQAFQHRKVCPTCGMAYGVQTGNMPPGTMNHFMESYTRLPGYERYGTIRIDYHFPSGTQGPEHPNPGQWYSGTSRSAYLPDCPEGREVLHLLKKAFDARLTFTIGRSVTTGASNVVTWNDIHHKTNPYGGATGYGYPDPTYLKRVKAELAAKGIS